jgi:hypothetical protein
MPRFALTGLPPTVLRPGMAVATVLDLIEARGQAATQAATEVIPDATQLPPDAVLVADTPLVADSQFLQIMLERDVQVVTALRAADKLEVALRTGKPYATLRKALTAALVPLRAPA